MTPSIVRVQKARAEAGMQFGLFVFCSLALVFVGGSYAISGLNKNASGSFQAVMDTQTTSTSTQGRPSDVSEGEWAYLKRKTMREGFSEQEADHIMYESEKLTRVLNARGK